MLAEQYTNRLSEINGLILPQTAPLMSHVYWLYTIVVQKGICTFNRDELMSQLDIQGIDTRPVFPRLNYQPAYRTSDSSNSHQDFPNSEYYENNGLCLPMSSNMSIEAVDHVCDAISSILAKFISLLSLSILCWISKDLFILFPPLLLATALT